MEGIDGTLMCWSSSFMDGGIRRKFIRPDWNHWDMIEVDADRHQVAQWFEAREGQRYDLLGLAGFVFRRFADDSKKYFCSEAVAAALGIPEPWRFDPNTLAAALGRRA